MMRLSPVTLVEVGMRDGLQSEKTVLTTAQKIRLIEGLAGAGLTRIQVTAFVNPARVPQMADSEAVCASMPLHSGVVYSALAVNVKGVERAAAASLTHIDIGVSASDAHSQRNTGKSADEALDGFSAMVRVARDAKMTVRAAVQCAWGYQSPVDVTLEQVTAIADRFSDLGAHEIALADSAGYATPPAVRRICEAILKRIGDIPLILHLHDTRGMGLVNLTAALELGIRQFDTAFGGLGGCPFIDGAAGNIPTEDTAELLGALGYQTGVNTQKVAAVSRSAAALLGRPLPGKLWAIEGR